MNRLTHDISLRVVKALNACLVTVPFALCWMYYYAPGTYSPFYRVGNWVVVLLFLVMYVIFGRVYDGFLVSLNRVSEIVYSQAIAAVIVDFCMYVIICLLSKRAVNPLQMLAVLAVQILISVVWSVAANRWYFSIFKPKKAIIIYNQRSGMQKLISEYGMGKKYDVVKTIRVENCVEDLSVLDEMEVAFLSDIHSHERNIILKYCVERDIDLLMIPRVGDLIMSGARRMHLFHLPMLRVGRYHPNPEYLFIKRAFDIAVSSIALVVLSPVMLVTAMAIKLHDHGPVFYRQRRLTKDGKEFNVLKFRSMRVDAEKDGVARLSTGDKDDRITPVGNFIRKCRIDELPQLLNILIGDMSVVGPRPERPEIAAQYEESLPEFQLRLQAKAGLTGYAQVYGKYNTTPYDKLQMDLMYIAHPSLIEDLRICFVTIKILFVSDSTEGVSEGSVTAADPIDPKDGE